ncbi:unnamed protein product [marine sediment metagenome]|uniref:Ribbon-helix-helix protein CopG domain-containing protein n=1 Tax=marine sediment metagenome TaxID=412755 RepID=X1RIB9_9ZZZZ
MPRLEIEITDKMMEKLQERAEAYAVEPSDVAKSIISCELARREKPCWIDNLTIIISRISEAMIAASKVEAEKSEQK